MFCGNVLDERMVSFLFSYEFEECFLIYTLRQKFRGDEYLKKNKFLLFFLRMKEVKRMLHILYNNYQANNNSLIHYKTDGQLKS